jgi:hypothetical protein
VRGPQRQISSSLPDRRSRRACSARGAEHPIRLPIASVRAAGAHSGPRPRRPSPSSKPHPRRNAARSRAVGATESTRRGPSSVSSAERLSQEKPHLRSRTGGPRRKRRRRHRLGAQSRPPQRRPPPRLMRPPNIGRPPPPRPRRHAVRRRLGWSSLLKTGPPGAPTRLPIARSTSVGRKAESCCRTTRTSRRGTPGSGAKLPSLS